ncbi:MAG: hypothetical protein ACR2JM_12610 [Mycobacterium sp.]
MALVLIAQLVAGVFVATSHPEALLVGDGRIVRLINHDGATGDALLARVRSEMSDAVDAVERFWGTDWTREIVVVATGSAAGFAAEARLDPGREWTDIAAVAVADSVDPARSEATGQRIVLAPGASVMTDPALRIVVTHELFHLAARTRTALDAPRWLTEGVADFVARPAAGLPPDAGKSTALPSDADLDTAGPGRSAGYDRAWWFARFIADGYGVDGLRRLYVYTCGPGHSDLASTVRSALGTDLAVLEARWAEWLTR